MNRTSFNSAGTLLIFGGIVVLMGIVTGEFYFRGYSVKNNPISDLGQRTDPSNASIKSALIFNSAMIIAGLAVIVAAYFLHNARLGNQIVIPLLIHGISIAGVGVFNSNVSTPHLVFAIATFLSGEFVAIASFTTSDGPAKYVFALLGLTSFIFLVGNPLFVKLMGTGGAERWIVYPTTIWLIAYGAYLLGTTAHTS